jgi:hypothetical protein
MPITAPPQSRMIATMAGSVSIKWDRSAEQVGAVDRIDVPDADRALRAVDFETRQFGIPDVEINIRRSD